MRHTIGGLLIRSLLDIRLSRLSLTVLALVSAAATLVIITDGKTASSTQLAALAALRRPAAPLAQAVAPPVTATTVSPVPPSTARGDGGGGAPAPSTASTSPLPTTASPAGGSGADGSGANATTDPASTPAGNATPASTTDTLPKVGHVFEIALSTTTYAAAFGHGSAAPYLRSLEARGTLLRGYESLGAGELADYLAMTSGQPPNGDTRAGCSSYAEFPQGTAAGSGGIVRGNGCVYPETALTIGDQVSAAGHHWGAYIEDMGTQTCAHPNSNAVDDLALPGTEPGYDTRHNPFVYFHSLLDLDDCASDDVDLSRLGAALASASRTPMLSFIAPGACGDAGPAASPSSSSVTSSTSSTSNPAATTTSATTTSASTSAATTTSASTTAATSTSATTPSTTTGTTPPAPAGCPAGQASGLGAEDQFLLRWVPRILRSPAYRTGGVLVIAFAGTNRAGRSLRTGALVISPYARRRRTVGAAYGPYSLLRSVEDMLGYTPLGRAGSAPSFAQAVLRQSM